jgi:hypothetical protein
MPTALRQRVLATAIASDARHRHTLESISPVLKPGTCTRETTCVHVEICQETELWLSASALTDANPPDKADRVPAWARPACLGGVCGRPIAVPAAHDERF